MDESDWLLKILAEYKGKKIFVAFNNAAIRGIGYFEGIMGDVFADCFSVIVGDEKEATRICYLKNVAFVQLLDN